MFHPYSQSVFLANHLYYRCTICTINPSSQLIICTIDFPSVRLPRCVVRTIQQFLTKAWRMQEIREYGRTNVRTDKKTEILTKMRWPVLGPNLFPMLFQGFHWLWNVVWVSKLFSFSEKRPLRGIMVRAVNKRVIHDIFTNLRLRGGEGISLTSLRYIQYDFSGLTRKMRT